MKTKILLTILIILIVVGVGLLIWGSCIIYNYEGYREIMKAARATAKPQLITGLVLVITAYFLTYVKGKK